MSILEVVTDSFRIVIWRPSTNNQDRMPLPSPVKGLVNVPINGTTPGKVLSAIKQSPGINRTQLAKLLKVDVKTISRAIAALSASVEHRGSKKAGGYYLISQ